MLFKRTAGIVAIAVFISSCIEQPTAATMPDVEIAAAGAGRVVSSARGSGHFDVNNEYRTFAFNARKSSDGTTDGQWQLQSRHTNSTLHGNVQCISFDGSTAWFSGVVTKSDLPSYPVGTVVGMIVVDNGEGAGAPADQVSLLPKVGATWCATPVATLINSVIGPFDIVNGNVQVTP